MAKKDEKTEAEQIATDRDNFAHHLAAYESGIAFVDDAKSALHNVIEAARQDGFTTEDLKFGLSLQKQKEREARAKIRRRLYIAKLLGNELGDQLDLFAEPAPAPKPPKVKWASPRDATDWKPDPTTGSMNTETGAVSGFIPMTAEELAEQQRLADEVGKQ